MRGLPAGIPRGAGNREPNKDSRLVANESNGAVFPASRPAERCRRLARDSTDSTLPSRLAEQYVAQAAAPENEDKAIWRAGQDDEGAG